MSNDKITGMFELIDVIVEIIEAAHPKKQRLLDKTMQAYHDDFPHEFHWALSGQAPALLFHLMQAIGGSACAADEEPKKKPVIRLVDRKPEGTA